MVFQLRKCWSTIGYYSNMVIFLSASKRQPRASTDRFLHLFPKNYTFPKNFPFCQFYPQTTIPYPSTDQFLHFFPKKYTFPKKFTLCQFYSQTTIPYPSTDQFLHQKNLSNYKSWLWYNKKSFWFKIHTIPSRAYWPKTLSG